MKQKMLLPSPSELIASGYNGMYCAIRKRPELFRHIPMSAQRPRYRTDEEAVRDAEKLAAGRKLPTMAHLKKHHNWLAMRIKKRPDLFRHLEQERGDDFRRGETLATALKAARTLVKERGYLPMAQTLEHEHGKGTRWLAHWMSKYPASFVMFPRRGGT